MPSPRSERFVGREVELGRLTKLLGQVRRTGAGVLLSMRGRRRVGKSRLVEEFIRKSRCSAVYFTPIQGPGSVELDRFLTAVGSSKAPAGAEVGRGVLATSWEAALELAVRGATKKTPIVLVLDEFPYLAAKEPTIEAVLQLLWDRTYRRAPVMVILIGSDRATMEALTTEGRPLFDRAREFVVSPLSPATIADMLGLAPAEALDAYAVIGGFPVLAIEWGRRRSLRDYLTEALTDPSSFLVISAERTLAAEFPADVQARAVLAAVGSGSRAHGALLSRAGLPQVSLDRALQILVDKGVVDRLTPYSAEAAGRNRLYVVSDPYLRFWLRFVGDGLDTIERGRGALVVDNALAGWPAFRGRAIEPIIRAAIEQLLPDSRFGGARHVGGYWNRTATVEVDLVGGDRQPVAKRIDFVGSIKWGEKRTFTRTDTAALAEQRGSVFGTDEKTRLIGVSRGGFAKDTGLDLELGAPEILDASRG